jgi:hypothetical protein
VVLTEFISWNVGEIPDAIGWTHGGKWSYLVECKTSTGDFYGDRKKPGRLLNHSQRRAIGRERYYMADRDVLTADLIEKHRPGWGLLEIRGRRVRVLRKAIPFDHTCLVSETPLMYSYIRRHQIRLKEQPNALSAKLGEMP